MQSGRTIWLQIMISCTEKKTLHKMRKCFNFLNCATYIWYVCRLLGVHVLRFSVIKCSRLLSSSVQCSLVILLWMFFQCSLINLPPCTLVHRTHSPAEDANPQNPTQSAGSREDLHLMLAQCTYNSVCFSWTRVWDDQFQWCGLDTYSCRHVSPPSTTTTTPSQTPQPHC